MKVQAHEARIGGFVAVVPIFWIGLRGFEASVRGHGGGLRGIESRVRRF